MEKTRRRVRSQHPESHPASLDPFLDQVSLYSVPSLYSIVSNHDYINSIRKTSQKVIATFCSGLGIDNV